MDGIELVVIKNPFNRRDRDITFERHTGRVSLAAMRTRMFPATIEPEVILNGALVTRERWAHVYPRPGDQVMLVPKIEGGGDGKSILRIVLTIAIAVVAWQVAPYLAGQMYMGSIGTGLLAGAIMMGGGMLINTLLPPPQSKLSSPANLSQTFSWSPATTQIQGGVIPRFYGINMLPGNIVSAFIQTDGDKQYYNALIDLGIGPYKTIGVDPFTNDRAVWINDQPDVQYNGVTVDIRRGDMDQVMYPAFDDTRSGYPVSVKLMYNVPYVYTTVDSGFNALEVEVIAPQGLWAAGSTGALSSQSVKIEVKARKVGDTDWTYLTETALTTTQTTGRKWSYGYYMNSIQSGHIIKTWVELASVVQSQMTPIARGKPTGVTRYGSWVWLSGTTSKVTSHLNYDTLKAATTSPVRRLYRLDDLDSGHYEISVTRLTADNTSSTVGNDLYLGNVNEVLYDDFTYPRMASAAVKALATNQLSGALRVKFLSETALVRVYDGTSWTVVFSRNPAWVCFDILTQPVFDNDLNIIRYDGYDPSYLDLPKFLEWADYCDDSVPDGKGGTEPRCRFDGGFDSEGDVWSNALKVCQTARATLVWNGVNITVAIDKRQPNYVQVFTVGNIGQDSFREKFLPLTDRASEIEVDIINMENGYTRDVFTVFNEDMEQTGKVSLQLLGVIRPSQAWREAKYRLYKNQLIERACDIDVDIDAIACTVGDRVDIQHDIPQWGEGGRIVSATTTSVTLDKTVLVEVGKSYQITVRKADDTILIRNLPAVTSTHYTSVVAISTPFDTPPAQFDVYAFGEAQLQTKPFIVSGIKRTSDQKATLSCVEYVDGVYNADDLEPAVPGYNYSALDVLPIVANLRASESLEVRQDGTIDTKLDVSFDKPITDMISKVEIWIEAGGQTYKGGETYTEEFTLKGIAEGLDYTVWAVSVNYLGQKRDFANSPSVLLHVYGKSAPPSDVANFTAVANRAWIDLTWDHIPDLDRRGYVIWYETGGYETFLTAMESGNRLTWQPTTTGNITFWIKAVDTTGHYSVNPSGFTFNVQGPPAVASLTPTIIDNNVLLRWQPVQGTFPIDYYEVRQGLDFDTAEVVGRVSGTFVSFLEVMAGNYKYWVTAKDTIGLYSDGVGTYVTVYNPPDFVLGNILNSDLSGTKVNCLVDNGKLYALVNVSETWQQHFDNNTWTSPQAQVNAGLPYYMQPGISTGSYEEVFDFGMIIPQARVTLLVTRQAVGGTVNVTPTISVSLDGTTWTDAAGVYDVSNGNFRYVKIHLDFASSNNGYMEISDIRLSFDARMKTVEGGITANASDTGGTPVDITGKFVDVISIQLTPAATTGMTAVYHFDDVPMPTTFYVYLFDSTGARATGTVSYTVKGV